MYVSDFCKIIASKSNLEKDEKLYVTGSNGIFDSNQIWDSLFNAFLI